ncbi:MAG: FAD-dependent oxidoreductase [Pseudomonadota bacterium]
MSTVRILGCGVFGIWQALTLARAGHAVSVAEASAVPFANAASRYAGAMIAPDCEAESAPGVIRDLGRIGRSIWAETYPDLAQRGTLVLAPARDRAELNRFAAATSSYRNVATGEIGDLEPDLAGRHHAGLYFEQEAHMAAPDALRFLMSAAEAAGVKFHFGETAGDGASDDHDWTIDCRGLGAGAAIPKLRGVRGERLVIETDGVRLNRTVRFVHPRQPLYIVPWPGGRFMVGATVVETDDASAMSVRSALELLGLAYTLHPAFGEARIIEMDAGVRPSLPDNVPRILRDADPRCLRVNGAFRHGFLLAPVLADAVAAFIASGEQRHAALWTSPEAAIL